MSKYIQNFLKRILVIL